MMKTTSAKESGVEASHGAAPESRERADRPPKLHPDEAAYLLERGPYVGRLRAKQRLRDLVLAFTIDDETASMMHPRQLDEVSQDIRRLEDELAAFDARFHHDEPAHEAPQTDNATDEAPRLRPVVIPVDFLKRREAAVCSETDPEVFFPEKGGSTRQAKRVCTESCDLTDECLEYALEQGERFGIWGGMSERERRKLAKNRASS